MTSELQPPTETAPIKFAVTVDIKDTPILNEAGQELFRIRHRSISRYMVIEATNLSNAAHVRDCHCEGLPLKDGKPDRKRCKESNPAVFEKELARRCMTWWSLEQNIRHHFDTVWEALSLEVGNTVSDAIGVKALMDEQLHKSEVEKAKNS